MTMKTPLARRLGAFAVLALIGSLSILTPADAAPIADDCALVGGTDGVKYNPPQAVPDDLEEGETPEVGDWTWEEGTAATITFSNTSYEGPTWNENQDKWEVETDAADWESDVALIGVVVKQGSQASDIVTFLPGDGPYEDDSFMDEDGMFGRLSNRDVRHAISHVTFCVGGGGGVDEGPDPLTVDIAAAGSYTLTYDWDIEKSLDSWVKPFGEDATLDYSVDADRDAGTASDIVVTGTVTVTNPNDDDQSLSAPTLTTGCAFDDTLPGTVPSGDTDLDFSCELDSVPASVTVTLGLATDTHTFVSDDWDVTEVNAEQGTITDEFNGGAAVVLVDDEYSNTLAFDEVCETAANTATIYGDADDVLDTDTVDATICGPRGGNTIGYWTNNNGTKEILRAPAVLGDVPSPLTTAYVAEVIKKVSSVDAVKMLKAQMLATALAVWSPERVGLGLHDSGVVYAGECWTVGDLLLFAGADDFLDTATRSELLEVKDVFDDINNNRQDTCG
jgi:hypothetical protein